MAYLNEADLFLLLSEGLNNAVDAVPGDSEDGVHVPVEQGLDEYVGSVFSHVRNACTRGAASAAEEAAEFRFGVIQYSFAGSGQGFPGAVDVEVQH